MNNNDMTLKDIISTHFNKEVIDAAEKCTNDIDVIKCAKSMKDFLKDANELKHNDQKIAAILLAEKLLADDLKK